MYIQPLISERKTNTFEENQTAFKFFSYFRHGMNNESQFNPALLKDLVTMKMPFGKYKGTTLCNLPVSYLEWFSAQGFPQGKLGMLLATMYEIKINGLDRLLDPLKWA